MLSLGIIKVVTINKNSKEINFKKTIQIEEFTLAVIKYYILEFNLDI